MLFALLLLASADNQHGLCLSLLLALELLHLLVLQSFVDLLSIEFLQKFLLGFLCKLLAVLLETCFAHQLVAVADQVVAGFDFFCIGVGKVFNLLSATSLLLFNFLFTFNQLVFQVLGLLDVVNKILLNFVVVLRFVVSVSDLVLLSKQCTDLVADLVHLAGHLVPLGLQISLALLDSLHLLSELLQLLVLLVQDGFDFFELGVKSIFLLGQFCDFRFNFAESYCLWDAGLQVVDFLDDLGLFVC